MTILEQLRGGPGRLDRATSERDSLKARGAELRSRIEALGAEYKRLFPVAEALPGSVAAVDRLEARERIGAIPPAGDALYHQLDEVGRELGRAQGAVSQMREALATAEHNLHAAEHPQPWSVESASERAQAAEQAKRVIRSITGNAPVPSKPEPPVEVLEVVTTVDASGLVVGRVKQQNRR